MYYVYILKLSDESYYIGSTNDLGKRKIEHDRGRVFSTKNRLPCVLVYTEQYQNRSDAQTREYQIKKWKSRKAIERLINAKSKMVSSSNG